MAVDGVALDVFCPLTALDASGEMHWDPPWLRRQGRDLGWQYRWMAPPWMATGITALEGTGLGAALDTSSYVSRQGGP